MASRSKVGYRYQPLREMLGPGLSLIAAIWMCSFLIFSAYLTNFESPSTGSEPASHVRSEADGPTVKLAKTSKMPTTTYVRGPFNFQKLVHAHNLARAFKPWNSPFSWCTHNYNAEEPTGLLYVKVEKAASSTTAGVALRIAHRHGRKTGGRNNSTALLSCDVKYGHLHTNKYLNNRHNAAGQVYGKRDKNRSFLFATIRDPASRAVSRTFFAVVSHEKRTPTDKNMLKWLHKGLHVFSSGKGGFQLSYISLDTISSQSAWDEKEGLDVVINPDEVQDNVRNAINDYDFLIVVERFDESLVAMQLLLDLDPGDILYSSAKSSAAESYSHNSISLGTCVKLQATFVSPAVKEYLESNEWYAKNYGDYLLHAAANKSLDMTIEALGRERFELALEEFLSLKKAANEKCADKAIWPCSAAGKGQWEKSRWNCYHKDQGCGYPCLDEFVANMRNR